MQEKFSIGTDGLDIYLKKSLPIRDPYRELMKHFADKWDSLKLRKPSNTFNTKKDYLKFLALDTHDLLITLHANKDILKLQDEDGNTLLHYFACDAGRMGFDKFIMDILAEQPLDFSIQNKLGYTPIHECLARCYPENDRSTAQYIFPFLIQQAVERNFDFSIQNNNGRSIIHTAAKSDPYEYHDRTYPLDTLLKYAKGHIDINQVSGEGLSPLFYAITYLKLHNAESLAQYGVDLKAGKNKKNTAEYIINNFEKSEVYKNLNKDSKVVAKQRIENVKKHHKENKGKSVDNKINLTNKEKQKQLEKKEPREENLIKKYPYSKQEQKEIKPIEKSNLLVEKLRENEKQKKKEINKNNEEAYDIVLRAIGQLYTGQKGQGPKLLHYCSELRTGSSRFLTLQENVKKLVLEEPNPLKINHLEFQKFIANHVFKLDDKYQLLIDENLLDYKNFKKEYDNYSESKKETKEENIIKKDPYSKQEQKEIKPIEKSTSFYDSSSEDSESSKDNYSPEKEKREREEIIKKNPHYTEKQQSEVRIFGETIDDFTSWAKNFEENEKQKKIESKKETKNSKTAKEMLEESIKLLYENKNLPQKEKKRYSELEKGKAGFSALKKNIEQVLVRYEKTAKEEKLLGSPTTIMDTPFSPTKLLPEFIATHVFKLDKNGHFSIKNSNTESFKEQYISFQNEQSEKRWKKTLNKPLNKNKTEKNQQTNVTLSSDNPKTKRKTEQEQENIIKENSPKITENQPNVIEVPREIPTSYHTWNPINPQEIQVKPQQILKQPDPSNNQGLDKPKFDNSPKDLMSFEQVIQPNNPISIEQKKPTIIEDNQPNPQIIPTFTPTLTSQGPLVNQLPVKQMQNLLDNQKPNSLQQIIQENKPIQGVFSEKEVEKSKNDTVLTALETQIKLKLKSAYDDIKEVNFVKISDTSLSIKFDYDLKNVGNTTVNVPLSKNIVEQLLSKEGKGYTFSNVQNAMGQQQKGNSLY